MGKKRKRHRDADPDLELLQEFSKSDRKRQKRRRKNEPLPRKGDPIPKGNAYKREQFNWRKALEKVEIISNEEGEEDADEEWLK